MAPKKGKKKSGKKKEKKDTEGEKTAEITVLDKNYYMTQIQALERTLERSNQRSEQLSSAEQHARQQYRNLHQEKVDIVTFLRQSLKGREDEIEELKCRLTGLVKARQTERDQYEKKLSNLNQEFIQTKNDLSDQILSLTRKLESLEDFRMQKEEMESQHALLQSTLAKEREQHQEKMSTLERSAIEESESLRKEQEMKIIEITEQLRKNARKEMHFTTRAAMVENETLKQALDQIQTKVIKLRQENNQVRSELTDMHIREEVLQESFAQMTSTAERRFVLLSKVTEKAEQHSKIVKDYESLKEEKEKLRRDLQQMQVQLDAATRVTCDLRESSSEKALALELLSTKLQEERNERIRISKALRKALKVLQESIFESSDDRESAVNNALLMQLVDILSSAEEGKVSAEDESEKSPTTRSKTEITKPLVTYTTGDLGLVPQKSKTKQK